MPKHCHGYQCQLLQLALQSIKDKDKIIRLLHQSLRHHQQLTFHFPN